MGQFGIVPNNLNSEVSGIVHRPQTATFINTSREDGNVFEKMGNFFLTPAQFIWIGRKISKMDLSQPHPEFRSEPRFRYPNTALYFVQIAFAIVYLIPGLVLGSVFKGIGCLSKKTRLAHKQIEQAFFGRSHTIPTPRPKQPAYSDEVYRPEKCSDRHGYQGDKDFLELIDILSKACRKEDIPMWLDYGSALGAYRYGGMIPWDSDADVGCFAIDIPRFYEAVVKALDPKKYRIEDWSIQSNPGKLFKIHILGKTKNIDVYTYDYNPSDDTVFLNYAYDQSLFSSKRIKAQYREEAKARRKAGEMFPLRKVIFDGVETAVPGNLEGYLSGYYSNFKEPCRVYNEETGSWDRIQDHRYYLEKDACT